MRNIIDVGESKALPRVPVADTLPPVQRPAPFEALRLEAVRWLKGEGNLQFDAELELLKRVGEVGRLSRLRDEPAPVLLLVRDISRDSLERRALVSLANGSAGLLEGPEIEPSSFSGKRGMPSFEEILRGLTRIGIAVTGAVHPVGRDAREVVWRTFYRTEPG